MREKQVIIKKLSSYDDPGLVNSVHDALEASGAAVCAQKKVLIKPNILGAAHPDEAVTTHPAVLGAVISYFKRHNCIVRVGDSPAIDPYKKSCRISGISEVCRRHNAELVEFSEVKEYEAVEGRYIKSFRVCTHFEWADYIVTVPKLKTHLQMYYTGALKNMFGMIKGLEKSRFHIRFVERKKFAGMIVDLNTLLRPSFAVMDAIVSMQGNGPRNGTPAHTGFVAVSSDPLALDYVCAHAIGYDPLKIPVIGDALSRPDFYIDSTDKITVSGDEDGLFRIPAFQKIGYVKDVAFLRGALPGFLYNALRRLLVKRPDFNRKRCVRCGKCVDICSAGALHLEDEGVIIDHSACVQCYCCHEVCPYNAVDLK